MAKKSAQPVEIGCLSHGGAGFLPSTVCHIDHMSSSFRLMFCHAKLRSVILSRLFSFFPECQIFCFCPLESSKNVLKQNTLRNPSSYLYLAGHAHLVMTSIRSFLTSMSARPAGGPAPVGGRRLWDSRNF